MITLLPLLLSIVAAPTYSVTHTYPIPGDGGWDYLTADGASNRLYISRGNHVQVMDTTNGQIVGDITGLSGVHGIAIASGSGKGYITNGRDASLTVFDLTTNKEIKRVKVGTGPDGILYDPFTKRVFTFNGGSNDATAVDTATDTVVGTVPLGGKPEGAESDHAGNVFVNIEDKSQVLQFDPTTCAVTRSWDLAPGEEPSGIGFDIEHNLVFSCCGNATMVVSDAKAGKALASAPTGAGTDAGGFDPTTGIAFSSNGSGTLSLAQFADGKLTNIQNVKTKTSARTMGLDTVHHKVYLIAADFDAPAAGQRRGRMKPGSAVIIEVGQD